MKQEPLTLRRWRRVEYERLVDLGAFAGDAVELVGGNLIVAEPQGTCHAASLGAVSRASASIGATRAASTRAPPSSTTGS